MPTTRKTTTAPLASAVKRPRAIEPPHAREHVDQDQERPDGQVLDQKDPDREPPELGQRAAEIAQHLQHHRGRGQGERAADDDRGLDGKPKVDRDRADHRSGHQDLGAGEPIDPGAEQAEALELELEA